MKTIPKPWPSTLAANSIESFVASSYLIVISSSLPNVNVWLSGILAPAVNVLKPVTPKVPPIVASLVTLKPVPLPFESVRVSEISAVLFKSNADDIVVIPVTPNVPATVVLPEAATT